MKEYPVSIEEMCTRYKQLYTGAIGDVLDGRDLRNQILPHYINPMAGDYTIAGPAFTGFGEPHEDKEEDDSQLRIEMLSEITPGCISVWQTNGHLESAHWGEIMSIAAIQRGCAGAVLDGGVRDIKFVKELGFPVFCRFSCSASSIGRWSIRKYQIPITIGRVQINPGDFVIADIDGALIVPSTIAFDVLEEVESFVNKEGDMRKKLQEGMTVKEVYEDLGSF